MMGLSLLRIEDITIYNYIKYQVIGLEFVESLIDQPLTYNSQLDMYFPSYDNFEPSPVSKGRGWAVFDEVLGEIDTSSEQASRVTVPGTTSYDVNYILGGIKNPDAVPTTADFSWYYVSVIDGWPGIDPPPLPTVAVDITGTVRRGFQLGLGHLSSRRVNLHVFATNNAERDDIVEALFNGLFNKSTKLIDYSQGDYLDHNGFFDSSFTQPTLPASSKIHFDNVSSRTMNNIGEWSDLNKYRANVSFDAVTYIQ